MASDRSATCAVHDQRELSVVEDPGDHAGLGFETRVPGEIERDLAVQGGLRLEHRQEHFCQPLQGVNAAMREVGFQVVGQRVSMQAGSIGARHRLRYRPLLCQTAFRTPFLAKCQVLRSRHLSYGR